MNKKSFDNFLKKNPEVRAYIAEVYREKPTHAFKDMKRLKKNVHRHSHLPGTLITSFGCLTFAAIALLPTVPPALIFFTLIPIGIFSDWKLCSIDTKKAEIESFEKVAEYIAHFNERAKTLDIHKKKLLAIPLHAMNTYRLN